MPSLGAGEDYIGTGAGASLTPGRRRDGGRVWLVLYLSSSLQVSHMSKGPLGCSLKLIYISHGGYILIVDIYV